MSSNNGSLRVSGRRVGLKGQSTYQVAPRAGNNKKGLDRRKPKNPLYQTIVLDKPTVLRKCHLITEKQSRYLSSKYGQLWLYRTYGRVTPTTARRHYTVRLLKRITVVWREEWWSDRREWRLDIRADCHYRYHLWLLIWRAWNDYVLDKRQDHSRNTTAIDYANNHSTALAFNMWRTVHLEQTITRHKVDNHYRHSLMKKLLRGWRRSVRVREYRERMRDRARMYHTSKILRQWRAHTDVVKGSRSNDATACDHFNNSLLSSVILHWRLYVLRSVKRRQMTINSVTYRNSQLVYKSFTSWRRAVTNQQCINDTVSTHYCTSLCNKGLRRWIEFTRKQQLKVAMTTRATTHYQNITMLKVFRIMSHGLSLRRKRRDMESLAVKNHMTHVLRSVWRVWLKQSEHCEVIKLRPLMYRAVQHYRRQVLGRYYSSWVTQRAVKLKVLEIVRSHCKLNVLPRCFEAFRLNARVSSYRRQLMDRSRGFRRSVQLSVCFYQWWRQLVQSLEEQCEEGVAMQHYCHGLMMHVFGLWRQKCALLNYHMLLEVKAEAYDDIRVSRVYFNVWRNQLLSFRTNEQKVSIISSYYHKRMIGKCFKCWAQYTIHKVHQRTTVQHHYSSTLINQCIQAWKVYHTEYNRAQYSVCRAVTHHSNRLCCKVITQWIHYTRDTVRFRRLLLKALYFARDRMLRRVFVLWYTLLSHITEQAVVETNHATSVRMSLDQNILRSVFDRWRLQSQLLCKERGKVTLAVAHFNLILLRGMFSKWCSYHSLKGTRKDLVTMATEFNNIRCISSCYGYWRIQTVAVQTSKVNTSVALWRWSHTVQLKSFMSWRQYMSDKRKKRSRYTVAMDGYRTTLLKEGVMQWIQTATTLQDARNRESFGVLVKDVSHVMECVRRCAIHWRDKTRYSHTHAVHDHTHSVHDHTHSVHDHTLPAPTLYPTDNRWDKLLDSVQLPKLTRPSPRRPDFLFDCAPPTSVIDSIPEDSLRPHPLPHPPNEHSFLSASTQSINTYCIIKPNDWKLLPPSAFTKIIK